MKSEGQTMIREEQKDLWSPDFDSYWRCILTNGGVNRVGQAVMGAGCALEAALRVPWLSNRYGTQLQAFPLGVYLVVEERLVMFPTKYLFNEKSSLPLIRGSCVQLRELIEGTEVRIVLPRPGCGSGGLDWGQVKPVVEQELGGLQNEIVVVSSGS